jgi:hypothetical protein
VTNQRHDDDTSTTRNHVTSVPIFRHLLIPISYLSISNLFLLSFVFRNIGRSFLKRLGDNKIRNRFVICLSKAFIGKSYNRYINTLGF